MAKAAKKSVKMSETHDRLSVRGTFATGASFGLTISRSGERLSWAGDNDPAVGEAQLRAFAAFCEARPGENNGARLRRVHDAAQRADSAAGFVALMG
jgi:hypothetical protein